MNYVLLDSGNGQKLERFGKIILIRPCAQAIWRPKLSEKEWGSSAHAKFSREQGNKWEILQHAPENWQMTFHGINFHLKRTDFGHLGIFPEHAFFWPWMQEKIRAETRRIKVLNLFAYSGGATLACAKAGAEVCHLDASKGMVEWARENAQLNGLGNAPIRWIVDDVKKYLKRAIRREEKYEGILLDPPSFGRGKSKEIFKIEEDLISILEDCTQLLSDTASFFILTCHSSGFTPFILKQLLGDVLKGEIEAGEMLLEGSRLLPSGCYARWTP